MAVIQGETAIEGQAHNVPSHCYCGAELVQPAAGRPRLTCSDTCRRAQDMARKRERRRPIIIRPSGRVEVDEAAPVVTPHEAPAQPLTEADDLGRAMALLHNAALPAAEREGEAERLLRRWRFEVVAWGPEHDRRYVIQRG